MGRGGFLKRWAAITPQSARRSAVADRGRHGALRLAVGLAVALVALVLAQESFAEDGADSAGEPVQVETEPAPDESGPVAEEDVPAESNDDTTVAEGDPVPTPEDEAAPSPDPAPAEDPVPPAPEETAPPPAPEQPAPPPPPAPEEPVPPPTEAPPTDPVPPVSEVPPSPAPPPSEPLPPADLPGIPPDSPSVVVIADGGSADSGLGSAPTLPPLDPSIQSALDAADHAAPSEAVGQGREVSDGRRKTSPVHAVAGDPTKLPAFPHSTRHVAGGAPAGQAGGAGSGGGGAVFFGLFAALLAALLSFAPRELGKLVDLAVAFPDPARVASGLKRPG